MFARSRAQDFHPDFSVRTDKRYIAHLHEAGEELTAIQALNPKVQELEQQNAALKSRLQRVEERARADLWEGLRCLEAPAGSFTAG